MKTEGPIVVPNKGVWMGDINHEDPPHWYKPKFAMCWDAAAGDYCLKYIPPHAVPFDDELGIV